MPGGGCFYEKMPLLGCRNKWAECGGLGVLARNLAVLNAELFRESIEVAVKSWLTDWPGEDPGRVKEKNGLWHKLEKGKINAFFSKSEFHIL